MTSKDKEVPTRPSLRSPTTRRIRSRAAALRAGPPGPSKAIQRSPLAAADGDRRSLRASENPAHDTA
jgi:hypothetical protein